MATDGGTRAVVAVLSANAGIAATKFLATVIHLEPDIFRDSEPTRRPQ